MITEQGQLPIIQTRVAEKWPLIRETISIQQIHLPRYTVIPGWEVVHPYIILIGRMTTVQEQLLRIPIKEAEIQVRRPIFRIQRLMENKLGKGAKCSFTVAAFRKVLANPCR